MIGFLKVFGKGILYTILLPFILLIWAGFTVYCIFLFIIMLIKSIVTWISGGSPFSDTKDDIRAKKILLERQNQNATPNNDQYKDALIATLATAVVQQANQPTNNVPTYDVFPTQEIEQTSEPTKLENYLENNEEETK